jgi:hypothetical protein
MNKAANICGCFLLAMAAAASAAEKITYVDATYGEAGNTKLAAGGVFNPVPDSNGSDNLWRLRTFGNPAGAGTIYEAGGQFGDANNPEDCPQLVTTVSGLPEGTYKVYVYFWSDDTSWRIRAGLKGGDGQLPLFYSRQLPMDAAPIGKPAAAEAKAEDFETAPLLSEGNRKLWQAELGEVKGTTITVFVDDDRAHRSFSLRTWYDGIGYQLVTQPAKAGSSADANKAVGATPQAQPVAGAAPQDKPAAEAVEVIKLLQPDLKKGIPVMEALSKRKTEKNLSDKKLTLQQLSEVLWAADGVNRPNGKRTAPAAMGKYAVDIYAVLPEGVYFYDVAKHELKLVAKGDYRRECGMQDFVYIAYLNLVYVLNLKEWQATPWPVPENKRDRWIACELGCITENVNIYCASEGLGAVIRGAIAVDESKFSKVIKVKPEQILLAQTIGCVK